MSGNPEFVAIVKEAIRHFDFAELNEVEQNAFRRMKQFGAKHARAALKNVMRKLKGGRTYVVSADLLGCVV